MASATILVLGGTGEARAIAAALDDAPGVRVISTLAGRIAGPRLPAGEVRVGGFGGPEGLAAYIADERVDAVVDATHPFAERMSWSAFEACAATGTKLVRVERPPFARDRAIDWREVASLDEAAAQLPSAGRRVFLTTGRQGLAAFAPVADAFFLVRCVDAPDPPRSARQHRPAGPRPVHARGRAGADRPPCARRPRHEGLRRRDDAGQARRRARTRAAGDRRRPPVATRGPDGADRRGGARLARRARSRTGYQLRGV